MQNKKLTEALHAANAQSQGDSSVMKGVVSSEENNAQGVYHVTCVGPKAEHLEDYAAIVEMARQMIEAGDRYAGERLIKDAAWMTEQKWADQIHNVVTTVGKNLALDSFLAGSAYTAAFYLGLIGSASYVSVPVAADTMASHASWVESQAYTQAARPTAVWAAASAGAKALSSALSFTINAAVTIKGCFLTTSPTKGGTAGILYSAGLFSGGDKVLANLDTLNVSYSTSM